MQEIRCRFHSEYGPGRVETDHEASSGVWSSEAELVADEALHEWRLGGDFPNSGLG